MVVILLLVAVPGVLSDPLMVPPEIQVPIFLKILTYDRTYEEWDGRTIRIAVLYAPGSAESEEYAESIIRHLAQRSGKTINDLPFDFEKFPMGSARLLEERIRRDTFDVLYLAPGLAGSLEEIISLSHKHHVLTISAVADDVPRGVMFALEVKGGKPRILVNLGSARAAGRRLKSKLLRLCRVIS